MSFRKYGGTSFSAKHNVVNSQYNNSQYLSVSDAVGQQNSYISFNSDISGNIYIIGSLIIKENVYVEGTLRANTITDGTATLTAGTLENALAHFFSTGFGLGGVCQHDLSIVAFF
jgi:hypothetical protein